MKVNVPIVSVISPMYQAARFIDATIESVLGQSYQSWEHILIDDCSSDGTAEIVRRYADRDPRLKLLSNSNNLGPSGSRNKGIRAARGRYLAFLDSDDLWEIEKLKKQIGFMTESDLALTYTACTRINEQGDPIGIVVPPPRVNYRMMLSTNHIACSSAVFDSMVFGKALFPNLGMCEDHALWLNLLKTVDWAQGLNVPLTRYRVRRDSLSANKLHAAKYSWKLLSEVERLQFPRALYYFVRYAYFASAKRVRARMQKRR